MRVILVCLIFFCSWKIPYISASEVGGPWFLLVNCNSTSAGEEKMLTSRHVDIDRHNPVTAPHDRVTVVVVATTVGTTAHADNPPGVGHLIVNLAQSRGHLVCQCTGHNHNIGLTRRSTENDSKTILIVTGGRKVHHLDGAACKTEGHGPQRALTSPIGNLIKGGPGEYRVSGSSRRILDESYREQTNKAYCIAPSFFSWLGKGTSRRALPDAVNCWAAADG